MPNAKEIQNQLKVPRRDAYVFLMIDNSINVPSDAIRMHDFALNEFIQSLSDIQKNSNIAIKLVMIEFNENCTVIKKEIPDSIEKALIDEILPSGKLSDFAKMLSVLNELIKDCCNREFTRFSFYAPICIFLTPGPSDQTHTEALNRLKENRVFRYGTKIALAIGEKPNIKEIVDIVGNEESVITNQDLYLFSRLFRFIEVEVDPLVDESSWKNWSI